MVGDEQAGRGGADAVPFQPDVEDLQQSLRPALLQPAPPIVGDEGIDRSDRGDPVDQVQSDPRQAHCLQGFRGRTAADVSR